MKVSPSIFVYLLVLVYPLGAYSIFVPGDVGFTPINFLSLLLFPFFVLFCFFRNEVPPLTMLGVLHLLYVFISLAGSIFAENQIAGLSGTVGYVVDTLLCFFYVLYFVRTRSQIKKIVWIFLFVGVIHVAMGLTQLLGYFVFGKVIMPPFAEHFRYDISLKNFGYETGLYSIPGFMQMTGFGSPGSASFGAELLIPLGLSLYKIWKNSSPRILYRFLFALFGLAILLSTARNACVGAFFMLLLLFLLKTARRPFSVVFRTYAIFLIILGTFSIFYTTRGATAGLDSIKIAGHTEIRNPLFLITRLNPFAGRFEASKRFFQEHGELAVRHAFDNLGFGRGPQNFDDFVFAHYPVKYGSHSNFILFLGDTGIWGFLVQILIVFMTIRYGLIAYFRQSQDKLDHHPLVLTAIYVGYVVAGIVRTFYIAPHTFLLMGLIAKLYTLSPQEPLPSPKGPAGGLTETS